VPRLGLSNSSSKIRDRAPTPIIWEDFTSGTASFNGTNANLLQTSTGLRVTTTSSGGYASRSVTCSASTKYSYRIKLHTSSAGSGDKTIMIGTSTGDASLVEVVNNTHGTIASGTFTTGGSTTEISVGLKVANNGKYAIWDDILIEPDDA
tara:strand:- start:54 stop:503 length:450 start_codon:yes stop_codon:yes gene_type:complete